MSPGRPAGDQAGCGRERANSRGEDEGGLAANQGRLHGPSGFLGAEKTGGLLSVAVDFTSHRSLQGDLHMLVSGQPVVERRDGGTLG